MQHKWGVLLQGSKQLLATWQTETFARGHACDSLDLGPISPPAHVLCQHQTLPRGAPLSPLADISNTPRLDSSSDSAVQLVIILASLRELHSTFLHDNMHLAEHTSACSTKGARSRVQEWHLQAIKGAGTPMKIDTPARAVHGDGPAANFTDRLHQVSLILMHTFDLRSKQTTCKYLSLW